MVQNLTCITKHYSKLLGQERLKKIEIKMMNFKAGDLAYVVKTKHYPILPRGFPKAISSSSILMGLLAKYIDMQIIINKKYFITYVTPKAFSNLLMTTMFSPLTLGLRSSN